MLKSYELLHKELIMRKIIINESKSDFFEYLIEDIEYNKSQTLKNYGAAIKKEIGETVGKEVEIEFEIIIGPVSRKIQILNDDDHSLDEEDIQRCLDRVFEAGNFWVVV